KMLKLILAWLREYRELIHVERVKALSVNLSPINLAWLGGIALHQANEGDLRWRVIIRLVEKKLGKYAPYFKTTRFDALQGKRLGVDPFFARFGLPIPCLQAADERKIRPRKHVIASHLWLRMRLLFGTNWRADIAVVMIRGLAQTPYQTAKILGCNYETAYRNWKSLKETEVETLGFVANLDSCK
ncbi:MAG: hypothetical protein HY072_02555, partial [Deltaproteobacteria bacterium]|nr:hypothetical protein [Deltaproteobacteria bacterium]